jgi:hypothetical protein
MTAKKITTKNSSVGKVVAIGATVAALSVGAYILFGPNGKKNKKAIKGWAIKMKGEIIEKLEDIKEVTAPVYESVVSMVADKYAKLKHIDAADLEAEVATLKKHWKAMTKGVAKKTVKRVTKKVVAKK